LQCLESNLAKLAKFPFTGKANLKGSLKKLQNIKKIENKMQIRHFLNNVD